MELARTGLVIGDKIKVWEKYFKQEAFKQENKLKEHFNSQLVKRNSAYGRHWISRRVRIVTPIPKETETAIKVKKRLNNLINFNVTCHMSCVMCHVSCYMSHVSPVTCNQSLVTNENKNVWVKKKMFLCFCLLFQKGTLWSIWHYFGTLIV